MIRAFTEQHPESKLTVLTKPQYTPLFERVENIDYFTVEIEGKHKGILGLYRLSRELRKLKIDAVADLHKVLRTKILKFFLFGTPFKQIDKGRAEKNALVMGEKFQQLKTTTQRYVEVFEQLGFPLDMTKPKFPPRINLKPETTNLIGADTKKWVGIAPFAAHQGKMYPLHLMEVVIKEIAKNHKVILFGGGKSEVDILNNLASKYENAVNVAGKFSLAEEIDIISNLDVMLAMDSGNAHLAAMMGVEVVTLWGVTHPYAGFYPFNQDINNALLTDREKFPKIPTSVYGNNYPEDYEDAMRSIEPMKVVEKINGVLS